MACFFVATGCLAQTKVNLGALSPQAGSPNFTTMSHTKPTQMGATLPGSCEIGDLFLYTTAGGKLYACTGTSNPGSWTDMGSGGGTVSAGVVGTAMLVQDTGSSNAYAGCPTPGLSAVPADGVAVALRAKSANDGAVTFALCGGAAVAVVNAGGSALSAGEIQAYGPNNPSAALLQYGSAAGVWALLNPARIVSMMTGSGVPSASCAAPGTSNLILYTDISASPPDDLWFCAGGNTWRKITTQASCPGCAGSVNLGQGTGNAQISVQNIPNDSTTGTIQYQLAKINSSGNAISASTSDTGVPVFVVTSATASAGYAQVAVSGQASCTTDAGGASIGHFLVASSTIAGTCHDAGATPPASGWVVGQAITAAVANGSVTIMLAPGYYAVAGGSGGNSLPTGNRGQILGYADTQLYQDWSPNNGRVTVWAKPSSSPSQGGWSKAGMSLTMSQIGGVCTFTNTTPSAGSPFPTADMAAAGAGYHACSTSSVGAYDWRTGQNNVFLAYHKLDQTTNSRMWLAWTSADSSLFLGADDLASRNLNISGFRASSATGDIDFMCVFANGTAQTATDSGVPIDIGWHTFQAGTDGLSFAIDGEPVCGNMATANKPLANTNMEYAFYIEGTAANIPATSHLGTFSLVSNH